MVAEDGLGHGDGVEDGAERILGDAEVSDLHGNFIVNRGGASASEVLALVDLIRERVYSLNQVELELELQVL